MSDDNENYFSTKDKEVNGQVTDGKLFNRFSVMWISLQFCGVNAALA
jgi:hypothetical protein